MKQVILFFALAGSAFGQYTIGMSTATNALGLQAATPTFSPAAGTYTSTQTVTISTATGGAVLCYTTDGSTPTEVSHLCSGGTTSTYSTPITVSTTQTVKAIATLALYTDSAVGSAAYVISVGPTFVTGNSFTFTGSGVQNIGFTVGAGDFVVLELGDYSISSPVTAIKIGSTSMSTCATCNFPQSGHGFVVEYYLYDTAGGDTQFTITCTACGTTVWSVGILEFSGTSPTISAQGTFESNQTSNATTATAWAGTTNYSPSGAVLAIGVGNFAGCSTQPTSQGVTSPWTSGTIYTASVFSTVAINMEYQLSTSSATAAAGTYAPTEKCYVTILTGGYS